MIEKQYNILQTAKDKEKATQLGVINKNKSMIKFALKIKLDKIEPSELLFKELAKKLIQENLYFIRDKMNFKIGKKTGKIVKHLLLLSYQAIITVQFVE